MPSTNQRRGSPGWEISSVNTGKLLRGKDPRQLEPDGGGRPSTACSMHRRPVSATSTATTAAMHARRRHARPDEGAQQHADQGEIESNLEALTAMQDGACGRFRGGRRVAVRA